MELNLETVERLRTKANITYEEARQALENTGGDLLEAIIQLERQGKITEPIGGGYYSSRQVNPGEPCAQAEAHCRHQRGRERKHPHHHRHLCKNFLHWCGRVIQKGNTNYLDVTKLEEPEGSAKKITSVPLTILAVLLIFAFWVIIPILIALLFLGYRYSFRGPEFNCDTLNQAMNKAAEAVDNIKAEVKEGMESQTEI